MKTGKVYFYTDQTKTILGTSCTCATEHFTVLVVDVFNHNVDEAERKARTVNAKLGFGKLPGGYFVDKCIPYNFRERYTVITVPENTTIQPYTAADLFIIGLIEYESNLEYEFV